MIAVATAAAQGRRGGGGLRPAPSMSRARSRNQLIFDDRPQALPGSWMRLSAVDSKGLGPDLGSLHGRFWPVARTG
jgi:hypothetical protein